jgi:eukaryotic-like serine/threonine-protein kinase
VEIRLGQDASARSHIEKAISIRERTLGPESPAVAMALTDAMNLESKEGHWAQMRALAGRALGIREKALGKEHPLVAESLQGLGEALDHLGRAGEAVPLLERAVAQREKDGNRGVDSAEAALAQALWDLGDRARARSFAMGALAHPTQDSRGHAALQRWADEHAVK